MTCNLRRCATRASAGLFRPTGGRYSGSAVGAGQLLNQRSAAFDVGALLTVAIEVLEVRVHPRVIAELVSVLQRSHAYLAMLLQVTADHEEGRSCTGLFERIEYRRASPADRGRRRT